MKNKIVFIIGILLLIPLASSISSKGAKASDLNSIPDLTPITFSACYKLMPRVPGYKGSELYITAKEKNIGLGDAGNHQDLIGINLDLEAISLDSPGLLQSYAAQNGLYYYHVPQIISGDTYTLWDGLWGWFNEASIPTVSYRIGDDVAGEVNTSNNYVDSGGPIPECASATPIPTPTPLVISVNSGGGSYNGWHADKQYTAGSWGFVNGATYSTTQTISNTNDILLYQTERFNNNLSYKFDVPNGNYDVILKFAEIYKPDCYVGDRVFDVKLEGIKHLSSFDIFKEVGCYKALDKEFVVSVNDGVLNIDFVSIMGNAKVSAIRVMKTSATPVPILTPTPTLVPTRSPAPTQTPMPTPIKTATPAPTNSPQLSVIRVNAGGSGYKDSLGNQWVADMGFVGGQTFSVTNSISGTQDQTIYKTERFGMSGYRFSVPNGRYQITLKFAEIYPYCQYAGCRVFNVRLKNTPYLTNFDIYQAAGGGYKVIDKTVGLDVYDGVIDITFQTVKGSPKISGIEIKQ